MSIPSLRWQFEDNNTKRAKKRPLTYYLFAGEMYLAMLSPSATGETYIPSVFLPDIGRIRYLPLEDAKAAVERAITLWFEACFRNEMEET